MMTDPLVPDPCHVVVEHPSAIMSSTVVHSTHVSRHAEILGRSPGCLQSATATGWRAGGKVDGTSVP